MLGATGSDSVVDAGRVGDGSLLLSVGRDDWILVACRPDLAGIEHTRRLIVDLRASQGPVSIAVVTIGDRPYGPSDVVAAMDCTTAFSIPIDPGGAAALLTGPARRARRSALVRAVRSLLDQVRADIGVPA
jgi:hypothetical protein